MLFRKLVYISFVAFALQSCVSGKKYREALAHIDQLKADSIVYNKRNRMLMEDKAYLETRSAGMEQLLTQRLQEKEDSLDQKELLLRERELSINDMKSRKAEERDAFESLSRSVFWLFKEYTDSEVHRYTNCTQISVEVSDKLLFIPGTTKVDPKASRIFNKVAEALAKNPDLSLVITGHTDSVVTMKEKFEDQRALGMLKANSIARALTREEKISPAKMITASRGETIPLTKSNEGLGRNRTEFIFYSAFLPCIHSKEE